MLTETVLGAITDAVFGYLLEKVAPVELTINWVTRKVGGEPDPKRRAFGQALDRACDRLATKHATWTASLFDGSLFEHEGAPILAQLLMRNGHPQPQALAACWAASLGLPDNEQRRALVAELEPVAAEFLVDLSEALKQEPALMEINDSRAFEQMVTELATIRSQLADAAPTVGRDRISAQIDWVNGNIVIGNDNQQVTYNVHTLIVQQQHVPEIDSAATRTHYLRWLIDRNRYLDPRGTQQTTRQVQLKLDEIYISLKAQIEESQSKLDRRLLQSELAQLESELIDLPAVEQEDRRDQLYARLGMQQRETVSTAPIDLNTAVAQHDKLVILGDPGSGKTTLLRYLALQNALALIDEEEGRFPILVRIADYAEDGAWKDHALSDFLAEVFKRNECSPPGLADLLQTELAAGGCLVLLDGLDEIVEADDRRGVVQRIEDFIRRHDQGGRRGENRFIVTSRIAGYRSAPLVGSGGEPLPHYVVQEMDDEQIERFLNRWCRAVEDFQTPELSEEARQATAKREIDGIREAIAKNPGVQRLAGNPLMLRILALIHRTGARLPQKRVELYRLAADTLARTWRTAQGVPESALISDNNLTPLLGQLAYWLHEHKPSGIATKREVYEQLGAAFAKRNRIPDWDPDEPDPTVVEEIDKFLLAVREHTGLFVERAPKRYGFMHLTFEEYYAARHLVARSRTRAQLIRKHLHDSRWEEPILLALGFVGLDYPDEAAELMETAILAQGEEAVELGFEPSEYEELLGRDYLFALRCLGDEIPVEPRITQMLFARLLNELLYLHGLARFQYHMLLLQERLAHLQNSDYAEQLAIQLLPLLHNEDTTVRLRVVVSLGLLESASTEVASGLLAALSDKSRHMRSQVVMSLGQLGRVSSEIDEAVVNGVLTALHDEDWYVRYQAAASLGRLGKTSSDVITGLVTALTDEDPDVQFGAVATLVQLGKVSSEVVDELMIALRHKDKKMRSRAAVSMGLLEGMSAEVVTGLLAALHDDDRNVRYDAAASLGRPENASAEVVSGLLAALSDDDETVRSRAAVSLGQLGNVSSEVIGNLLAALYDKEALMRSRTAESLVQLGSESIEIVDGLLAALHDKNKDVRLIATESLLKLGNGSSKVVNGLLAALRDDSNDVRFMAATGLAQLRQTSPKIQKKIINSLFVALDDEFENVRYRVAISLGQLGSLSSEINNSICSAAQRADNSSVRKDAVQLLGQLEFNMKRSEQILIQGLLDANDSVRTVSGLALAQLAKRFPIRNKVITQYLATAINDPVFESTTVLGSRTGQDYAHEALWRVMAG